MRLNKDRVVRYLDAQKKINDYLSKVSTKNRDAMILFSEAKYFLIQGEHKLRDLLQIVAEENVNE